MNECTPLVPGRGRGRGRRRRARRALRRAAPRRRLGFARRRRRPGAGEGDAGAVRREHLRLGGAQLRWHLFVVVGTQIQRPKTRFKILGEAARDVPRARTRTSRKRALVVSVASRGADPAMPAPPSRTPPFEGQAEIARRSMVPSFLQNRGIKLRLDVVAGTLLLCLSQSIKLCSPCAGQHGRAG